ncbi:MAG: MFS transporter [Planctomycetota bacterium]
MSDLSNPSAKSSSALQYASFRYYSAARFFMTLAVQMQSVAIGWQVFEATGDPMDLGLIGLAQFLPFVVLTLPAGQIADRFDRKWILTLCCCVETLCALLFLAWSLTPGIGVWPVFAVLVLFGSVRAFSMPTSQAITPNLVPLEAFPSAVAFNSSLGHIATIAGPALGGLLYILGASFVYSVISGIFAVSVALMLRVTVPERLRVTRPAATWHDLLEGVRFVRSRPVLLGAISLDLFAVLFGGAVALLPAFASEILRTGPQGLGILRATPATGAAFVAILLVAHPITRNVGRWLFCGVALFGVSILVFGFSQSFFVSLLALFVMGASDMVSVYIRHTLMQLETPDEIRGRVAAVSAVFIGASNELGEFESGVTAAWWGIVPAVLVGGTVTLSIAVLWARLFPPLWHMDEFAVPSAKDTT